MATLALIGVESWLPGIEPGNRLLRLPPCDLSETIGKLSLACFNFCSFSFGGEMLLTIVGDTLILVWS